MNSEALGAQTSCPQRAPGVRGIAPLMMRPTGKVFHMTQIKKIIFFISLFYFNKLLATWKGVLAPMGLPLLAASWMGDAKSQGGCKLAPCCSNKFKQATLPLTQALNNGVCQSTVTPFTWGEKKTQSGFVFVFSVFHNRLKLSSFSTANRVLNTFYLIPCKNCLLVLRITSFY